MLQETGFLKLGRKVIVQNLMIKDSGRVEAANRPQSRINRGFKG